MARVLNTFKQVFSITLQTIRSKRQFINTSIITLVWLINGLYCKVYNGVPRHEQIIVAILNSDSPRVYTILIGLGEVIIALWYLSRIQIFYCVLVQIILIASMNLIEFILVPNMLLWGKLNLVFALFFIAFIYHYEFKINSVFKY